MTSEQKAHFQTESGGLVGRKQSRKNEMEGKMLSSGPIGGKAEPVL